MLRHKLALRLGCGTVRELSARLDAQEWARWRAFDEVSPLGDERLERMLATLIAVVLNKLRGEGDDPVTVEDVTPDHGGARAEAEAEYRRSAEYRRAQAARVSEGWKAYTEGRRRRGRD